MRTYKQEDSSASWEDNRLVTITNDQKLSAVITEPLNLRWFPLLTSHQASDRSKMRKSDCKHPGTSPKKNWPLCFHKFKKTSFWSKTLDMQSFIKSRTKGWGRLHDLRHERRSIKFFGLRLALMSPHLGNSARCLIDSQLTLSSTDCLIFRNMISEVFNDEWLIIDEARWRHEKCLIARRTHVTFLSPAFDIETPRSQKGE